MHLQNIPTHGKPANPLQLMLHRSRVVTMLLDQQQGNHLGNELGQRLVHVICLFDGLALNRFHFRQTK